MRNTFIRTWNMARKTEKGGKFRNVHSRRGIWQENWKSWKMRNIHLTTWKMTKSLKNVKNEKCTLKDLEYGEKTENHGKWEIHTLGREIWRGKLKKVENLEMSTVGRGIWQENWKSRKMRNTHFMTWNMAGKTEKGIIFRNVHCRTWNMARKLKIMENKKHPIDDLKNDEITKKREKWEMHTEGPGIWRENWKRWKI